jgi:hypothetical protein
MSQRNGTQLLALKRALEDTQTAWGSSRWATIRECGEKHRIGYLVGLERIVEGPREEYYDVGSLCHGVLRYVQDGLVCGETRVWGDVLDYACEQGWSTWPLEEAYRLMKWYFAAWGEENAGWGSDSVIVGVEQLMEWPGVDGGPPHTGRADTLLRIGDEIVVVDTKTRGRDVPGYGVKGLNDEEKLHEYISGLTTRPQFCSLSAMTQAQYGLDVPPSVMVNCIVKTKVPAYRRLVVPMTPERVSAWAAQQAEWSRSYGALGSRQNWSACAPEIGNKCKFFGYCHVSQAARDMNWRAGEKKTTETEDLE